MARCAGPLTFLQHPHFEALHEAAGLAGLAPPFGDLTFVGGRAAVLDVPWNQTQTGLPGAAQCPYLPAKGWVGINWLDLQLLPTTCVIYIRSQSSEAGPLGPHLTNQEAETGGAEMSSPRPH